MPLTWGADLLIVPKDARSHLTGGQLLYTGVPAPMYMDEAVMDTIRSLDGVQQARSLDDVGRAALLQFDHHARGIGSGCSLRRIPMPTSHHVHQAIQILIQLLVGLVIELAGEIDAACGSDATTYPIKYNHQDSVRFFYTSADELGEFYLRPRWISG